MKNNYTTTDASNYTTVNSQRIYRPPFLSAFLHPKSWGVWLVIGFMMGTVFLPHRLRRAIGAGYGALFFRYNTKRRHIAAVNLDLCFPHKTPATRAQMLREHFRYFGQGVIDINLLWWASRHRLARLIQYRGLERLQQILASRRRVILLSPHSVCADLPGLMLSQFGSTVAMMKPMRNPLMNYFLCHGRRRNDVTLVTRDQGAAHMVRILRRHQMLFYLPDEDHGLKSEKESVFAPFFATRAATITALARLAHVADALVVPVCSRLIKPNGGYRIYIGAPLKNFPSGDALADATQMNRALEDMLMDAPAQYMWTLRRFKTRPNGQPSPYL